MSCLVPARLLCLVLVGLLGAACAGAPGTPGPAPAATTAPAAANAAQARPPAVPAASPAAAAVAGRQPPRVCRPRREQDYSTALAAVRQAESQRAGLQSQLKRARTPEEESSLRDKLGQADLVLQRERGKLSVLDQQATRLKIALPRPDEAATAPAGDDALGAAYIQTRVDLRRAQADQRQVTADLESGAPDVSPDRLQAAILRSNDLTVRLKTIQERAGQIGIALPTISPAEETAMAQVPSRPTNDGTLMLRRAWEASLTSLVAIGSALVFVWWLLLPLGIGATLLARRRYFRRKLRGT